ncbi:MAG: HAMP domain-containing histidine kinase [Firmicutes bacterium]|nr:HAMP domain-containing histidine kinase [Bacillota bacterium]
MATKWKRYSRSRAAKIAAYATLIICLCLIFNLLSEFIYAHDSDLESVVQEEYYNSNTYYDDVELALYATYNLLQLPKEAEAPQRYYYYYAYNGLNGRLIANIAPLGAHELSGYLYGFLGAEISMLRVDDGATQPLLWEDKVNIDLLTAHTSYLYNSPTDSIVYVIFTDDLIYERQKAWEDERAILLGSAERSLAVLFIIVPLLMYLALVTGRRPKDEELHSGSLDALYSEALFLLLFLTVAGGGLLWFNAVEAIRRQLYYSQAGLPQDTLQLLSLALTIFVGFMVLCSLLLLNALIRKIKAQTLVKHSLAYQLFYLLAKLLGKIWPAATDAFRQVFVGPEYGEGDPAEGMFYRQRRFLITTAAAMLLLILFLRLNIWQLFILTLLSEAVVVYNFLRGNQKDMAAVKASVEKSLNEQMRLEKLKIELVTNVSHDLKTPLTSIISYVELLNKEKNLSPSARDYVQVLNEKSRRLDRIVSDLFELAKATSDNIPLELEMLDLKLLFTQTLADMGDSIEASGLLLRANLAEQPLPVLADGNRLYRMLQNVLDNALKYSLFGSRLFIDLTEKDGRAIGVVKNTAAYEMKFSAEDVLRRFSRGDSARSSEGSGLGLAIAKSFCERCGGKFNIFIDGDQFKVVMEFQLKTSTISQSHDPGTSNSTLLSASIIAN